MSELMEIWKPVVGHEQWYEVSNLGRVKRVKPAGGARVGVCLKPFPNNSGYYRVFPCINGKNITCYIHHLVALAFLGPRPDGHDINHKDGCKTNNSADNLEYVTRTENHLHAIENGLWRLGEKHYNSKLTEPEIVRIRSLSHFMPHSHIAELFNVHRSTIYEIVQRKIWKHVA